MISPAAAREHNQTHNLQSRFVTVDEIPWEPTQFDGVEMKVLLREPNDGLLTALIRMAPGSSLPLHEHVAIEQSYMLSGTLEDDDGIVTAGNFVWRPAGHRHVATSPTGALLLAFFIRPNRFLSEADAAQSP